MSRLALVVSALALVSACKPPPQLVSQDAQLTARIGELEDLIRDEKKLEPERVELDATLASFAIDSAAVSEVAGPDAKTKTSGLSVRITAKGTPAAGLELATRLLKRQPELRLSSFEYDATEVTLEAEGFDATVVPDDEPWLMTEPGVPSFCSRRCKDLVANISAQQARLAQLRTRAKALLLISAQRRAILGVKMMQETHPPNAEALVLLAAVLEKKWMQPAASKHEVTFLLDGTAPSVQLDVTSLEQAKCTAEFEPLAHCTVYGEGGRLTVSLNAAK